MNCPHESPDIVDIFRATPSVPGALLTIDIATWGLYTPMLVSCCNSTRLLIVNRFLADMAGQREGGKATRDCIANRKRLTT